MIADDIIARLEQLSPASTALWGKMSVGQMLAHCADIFRDILRDRETPVLVSPEIAERARKIILAPEPFPRELRAIRHYRPEDGGTKPTEFMTDRDSLIDSIRRFESTTPEYSFGPHPAIGFLTREEHSLHIWKHLDHHLQQFGV